MAEELNLKVNLETDYKNLKEAASKVPLSSEQSAKVEKGLMAAEKALNAQDWDSFRSSINKVSKVLTQAIAATGNISDSLQHAIDLKNKIEESINNLTDRINKIKSKYVDQDINKGLTNAGRREAYLSWKKEEGIEDIRSNNNQVLGVDTIINRFNELNKVLQDTGKTITSITNEQARASGFQDRNAVFAARRYAEYESRIPSQDLNQINALEESLANENKDLQRFQEEIERLTPISNEAASGLENLYKSIVNLVSSLNTNITSQKGTERAARSQATGAAPQIVDINNSTGALNKQSSSLGRAFKQFTLYTIALRTVKKALHEAIGTIKNLDKYLTEQAMVTGKTRKETYALLKDYQNMAASLGATTKEVAEVATQFMRQGKTTADALTLTTAAISAAKVAGISATESVNYLTTALNGFQLSAQQAMAVSDKFASIAAQSATSYEEIATALSKVAAQANMAGMSIDYTTALLAKGIETTREAPETIGTALKTVIARMRELTDYGATLEDGMSINNVETQLAYVGIALRNTNGELRSTEDVLNDLGKQWDTLNSNQQAAIAKALAGTRQQSRLIAMMTDYERVTELQQIAERSAGATAAQAATYMEGMEAALNKVNVAWEKIVTNISNSDTIINAINFVSTLLDRLGDFLASTGGMITTMAIAGTLALAALGHKMKEYRLAKEQQKVQQKISVMQAQSNVIAQKKLILEKEQTLEKYKQAMADAETEGREDDVLKYQKLIQEETASLQLEKEKLHVMEAQVKEQEASANWITSMTSGLTGLLTPLISIIALWRLMALGITKVLGLQKAQEIQQDKNNKKSLLGALFSSADSAAKIPFTGWVIALGILAAAGVAIGVSIAAMNGAFSNNQAEKTADDINKLSNEIYKLTERANAIKTLEDQYDALDKKIIKTTEDQAKMNELLDSAADKLDTENQKDNKGKEIEGTSQQDQFKAIETEQEKLVFLQNAEAEARDQANAKRQEQLDLLNELDPKEREAILNSKDNTEALKVQSAVRAINNNTLYEYIDTLEDAGQETETFTQAILDQLTAEQQYNYAIEQDSHSIQNLVNAVDKATTVINGQRIRWTDVLNSGDYSFNERIQAFDELRKSIVALNDTNLTAAFDKAYQQWDQLARNINDTARDFMDQVGMTIDRLNDWGLAVQKFGLSTEEAANRIGQVMNDIANGWTIGESIRAVFSDILDDFEEGSEDWLAAYNKLLNAYQSAMNVSILNMGQNLESLKNRVSNIYEQAQKWNTLSDTERTTFMNDNADLFSGEDGARLYEAFKTQNYNLIQQALENNKVLNDTIEKRKQELQLLLDIEQARADEDRNEGQIAYLKEQIKLLEETKDIYRASLKLRLEQEQSQLDIYKEYLQKQQDALSDSLEKRKEAYEKYFETINQEAEDEEYEEKAELLIGNLSKLAASDDASSKMQSAELEAQLRELEEERLKELRERAQQAVIQNIDDQLTQISEKFDKLLENNQLLLQAMTAQITGDPTGFVSQMLASGTQGMTALGAENYLEEFRATFGSILPASALENISISESTTGDTLILNIAGTEVEIGDSTQQELYLAIMRAMRQLGIK